MSATRRRGRLGWALVIALVVVPLVEIYVLVQVGQVIGAWWTIGLLILDSILGGWLIRREGARAWRALRTALDEGRMPTRELADGALILIGGTLMLTPGFVSDVFGVLMILPFTRPLFRRLLVAMVGARVGAMAGGAVTSRIGRGWGVPPGGGPVGPTSPGGPHGPAGGGPVVQGDVVDDDGPGSR